MKQFPSEFENFRAKFSSSEIYTEGSQDDLHDFYEIAFFIKANLQIFIKDAKYDICDGDLFFINKNELHHIFYNKASQYVRYVVHFKKVFIMEILKSLNLEYIFDYIEKTDYKKISINLKHIGSLETLFKPLTKKDSAYTDQKNKLNLALILINYYEELKKYQPVKETSKSYFQIMKIVQYIDADFSDKIDLDSLEKKFFLNKFYISHIFKNITGFSVMQYIQYRRVIEAQKLLKYSDKDIINVCYECGFNSIQDFYRVFKKVSGTTPSKYKK